MVAVFLRMLAVMAVGVSMAVSAGQLLSEHEHEKAQQKHQGDNHCTL
jgi:hypothetical protein